MSQPINSFFSQVNLVEEFRRVFAISENTSDKLLTSLTILIVLTFLKLFFDRYARKHFDEPTLAYHYHRLIFYFYAFCMLFFIGRIWVGGIDSLTTFLGLFSAGLAISLHDIFANFAGWVYILWRQPFRLGDRIEIGNIAGDVVDIRMFQFSVVEIGNWVDADQSTGRIIHIPNAKILRESLANYHIGFAFIWNEISLKITFDSDWKAAKSILSEILDEIATPLAVGAQEQIRESAEKYLIHYSKLTPIVYTAVRDNGIVLSARYLVDPRKRRSTEQQIWEAVLEKMASQKEITLAYPATRVFISDKKVID